MTDWRKEFKKQIDYCAYCPKLCRFSCPVAEHERKETMTPTGKATALKLVADGKLPFGKDIGELVYACSGCLITRTYCEHDIDVFSFLTAARAEAVKTGVAPEAAINFADKWRKHGNPYEEDLDKVIRDAAPKEIIDEKADAVLFTGCALPHYFPEQIGHAAKVLSSLGRSFTILHGADVCCGYPLLELGHQDDFIEQAEKIAACLNDRSLVITPCPSCAYFLRERYREFNIEINAEVLHLTEYLAPRLDKLPIKKTDAKKAIYHDPCYLGRYLGVYDQPRKILEAATGIAPLEFFENREAAVCCGGGGGLPITRPETARGIALARAGAIDQSGAQVLATACPACQRMLGKAHQGKAVSFESVVSILAGCLEE